MQAFGSLSQPSLSTFLFKAWQTSFAAVGREELQYLALMVSKHIYQEHTNTLLKQSFGGRLRDHMCVYGI